jgi:DNA-directed RNA polymerase subunit RPC12/RpoP
MPIKYHCPSCNRRFVDWGAEKLEFKCPDCDGEKLILVGADKESGTAAQKPSLKRSAKVAVKGTKKKQVAKVKETALLHDEDVSDTDDGEEIVEAGLNVNKFDSVENIDDDVEVDDDDDDEVVDDDEEDDIEVEDVEDIDDDDDEEEEDDEDKDIDVDSVDDLSGLISVDDDEL